MSPRPWEGGVRWPWVTLISPLSWEKGVGRRGEAPGLSPQGISGSASGEAPSGSGVCVSRLPQPLGPLLASAFVRTPEPQAKGNAWA